MKMKAEWFAERINVSERHSLWWERTLDGVLTEVGEDQAIEDCDTEIEACIVRLARLQEARTQLKRRIDAREIHAGGGE